VWQEVNSKAAEEILALERRYNQVRKPIYDKRNELFKNIPQFWLKAVRFFRRFFRLAASVCRSARGASDCACYETRIVAISRLLVSSSSLRFSVSGLGLRSKIRVFFFAGRVMTFSIDDLSYCIYVRCDASFLLP
jgi:hypothetical protein